MDRSRGSRLPSRSNRPRQNAIIARRGLVFAGPGRERLGIFDSIRLTAFESFTKLWVLLVAGRIRAILQTGNSGEPLVWRRFRDGPAAVSCPKRDERFKPSLLLWKCHCSRLFG